MKASKPYITVFDYVKKYGVAKTKRVSYGKEREAYQQTMRLLNGQ